MTHARVEGSAVSETPKLGKVGVWIGGPPSPELARGLDDLGFGAIWIGGSPGGNLDGVERTLAATSRLTVATGIVNVWKDDPATIAASYHRLADAYPVRFLLGIGVGHPEATSQYTRPYEALVDYLDALDTAGVPSSQRALAALGPKVLRLAAERTAAAHPYLVTPEHTRRARAVLGTGTLLAPEQHVVLDADTTRAREVARNALGRYLNRSNYTTNCGGWASPTTTSPAPAATGSLTGWSRSATPSRSPPGSPRTSTPAPTTSASSSSPARAATRCPVLPSWLRSCSPEPRPRHVRAARCTTGRWNQI